MKEADIKNILFEQKREVAEIARASTVSRDVEKAAKALLKDKLVKVIIGVRRCGKSSLAHKILSDRDYGYVNFDDERLVGVKAGELNGFLEVMKGMDPKIKTLLFDEIQNVEGWELFANRLARTGYNLVVTGSNAKLLSRELATHLTGRHAAIELFPFSFREFIRQRKISLSAASFYVAEERAIIKKALESYLEQGGFPELFLISNKNQYLRDLYDKIISRDIIPRHKIKYGKDLKELALYLFSNFGGRFSFQKLRKLCDIKSVHTVKNYIGYLEEAYLLFQLPPFSFKLKNQIKGKKKIYAIDSGMIKAVSFRSSSDTGRIMENAVFVGLKRRGHDLYYYSGANCEVDFVIREKNKVKELMQVCYNMDEEETREREIRALLRASKDLSCNRLRVISWDKEGEEKIKNKKIIYTPLYQFLLE